MKRETMQLFQPSPNLEKIKEQESEINALSVEKQRLQQELSSSSSQLKEQEQKIQELDFMQHLISLDMANGQQCLDIRNRLKELKFVKLDNRYWLCDGFGPVLTGKDARRTDLKTYLEHKRDTDESWQHLFTNRGN